MIYSIQALEFVSEDEFYSREDDESREEAEPSISELCMFFPGQDSMSLSFARCVARKP